MKKFIFPCFTVLISTVLLCLTGVSSAYAQTSDATSSEPVTQVPGPKIDWDTDIRSIRLNDIPSFRYRYDDYLQFSPAAAMILMRACGVEGRSKEGAEWLCAEAFSAGIMAATVNGIKYSVRRLRPDNSTRNSFPSGHTATAFMCATMLHEEYGWRSPWISLASYGVASITGASRIMNHRHWFTDVFAGAVIGVGSVKLGYLINDAIFKKKNISDAWEPLDFDDDKSLLYYSIESLYGHRYGIGEKGKFSGGVVAVQADFPIRPRISARFRLGINSLRDRHTDSATASELGLTCNFYDYLGGAVVNFPFAKILYVEADMMVGGGYRSFRCPEAMKSQISKGYGELLCGGAFGVRVSSNFCLKFQTEYDILFPINHSLLLAVGSSFFW